jgi:hypothetical protein
MDQQHPNQPHSIREIGHLFLSSVRQRHTDGRTPPVRIPPPQPTDPQSPPRMKPHNSIDLTPEEYAQVFGGAEPGTRSMDTGEADEPARIPPITALITLHLNGRADERVREYARHLAANGERIGVLEVDGSELRLLRFERSIQPNEANSSPAEITEHFDHRSISAALEEMGWDLDRWLLILPSMRSPEARGLLREVDHWTVLSTCDHDGVVSCYRTLKGLSGGLDEARRPKMTLALLDAPSDAVATNVLRKLRNVCLEFLGIELEGEPAVRLTRAVAEHLVMHCRMNRDKAQLAAGVQWIVVEEFLARARAQAAEEALRDAELDLAEKTIPNSNFDPPTKPQQPQPPQQSTPAPTAETVMPVSPVRHEPVMQVPTNPSDQPADEVIDLPGDAVTEQTVVAAVLGGSRGELIECPVRAPMCPDARLAVTRDRGLIVLAVARKGLSELRAIAQAYRWAVENRALIAMAVPQLAIDAHRHPRLRLIVDHADVSASVLAPMLENETVSVQAYRKLRWNGKTGLLLEAA